MHNISCSENGAGVADPSIGEGLVVGDAMLVQSTVHLSRNDGFSVLRLGLNATGGNVSVVQNGALGDGAFIKGLTSLNGTLLVSGQREMGALTVMLPGAEVAGIAAHLIVEENAAISSVDFGDALLFPWIDYVQVTVSYHRSSHYVSYEGTRVVIEADPLGGGWEERTFIHVEVRQAMPEL